MTRFPGGCLCGQVRFEASGRPSRVGICHCLDCRKHHGAPFHASAFLPQQAVWHLSSRDLPDPFKPTYERWTVWRESWLPPFANTRRYERARDADGCVEP